MNKNPETKPNLPPAAMPAWKSYHAMHRSKQNHLNFLVFLEEKYKRYGQPNDRETHHLAALLKEHDQHVNLFTTTLKKLKQTDHDAHQIFITYLATLDLPEPKR